MRPVAAVFGAIGTLATAFGVGLLFVPDVLLEIGPVATGISVIEAMNTAIVGILAGTLVVGSLFVIARTPNAQRQEDPQSSADPRFEHAANVPPEDVATEPTTLTAAGVDSDIRDAVETGGDALHDVRTMLYDTATSAYAERAGVSSEAATRAVSRGEWTSDPVAAVFLAGPDGPAPTLKMQIRLWLVPTRERSRRIERALAAIEEVTHR
jgi:hypothetical protein